MFAALAALCIPAFGQTTATDWIKGAENLTSYSIKSSVTQTLKLFDTGANATSEKVTVTETAETVAIVNMSSLEAHARGSTKNQMEMPDLPANTSTTSADVYQIGNSTYVNDESGNWTHLVDPRSMQEVWGPDKNNQVKAIAETFNLSTTENLGSEAINGEDAYKLKIVTGSGDNINLYNTSLAIAAKVTQYPMYLPSVNRTELNETGKIEKTIWISKKSYLPVKYQSLMSFSMTPEIVGASDPNTGQMNMLNQSIWLGEISVNIATDDLYYDFDKPTDITPPEQALSAQVITPAQVQTQGLSPTTRSQKQDIEYIEVDTQNFGDGFKFVLLIYNNEDRAIGTFGKFNGEIRSDDGTVLYSQTFDVVTGDFNTYENKFTGVETRNVWMSPRIKFEDINDWESNTIYDVYGTFTGRDGVVCKDTGIVLK